MQANRASNPDAHAACVTAKPAPFLRARFGESAVLLTVLTPTSCRVGRGVLVPRSSFLAVRLPCIRDFWSESISCRNRGSVPAFPLALAARRAGQSHRVVVLLSDGECDEGSVWEAALFAGHHKLDNLTAIVDFNRIQAFGNTSEVLNLEPFADKWAAFGWETKSVDGHDLPALEAALASLPFRAGKPSLLIARTVKGKGVSFMENQLAWHYKSPNPEELETALKELA